MIPVWFGAFASIGYLVRKAELKQITSLDRESDILVKSRREILMAADGNHINN